VPKAIDLRRGDLTEEKRRDAFFGDNFKAPGVAPDAQQRPDKARGDGQHEALDEGESGMSFGGHTIILK
jgi:hypothetical protein